MVFVGILGLIIGSFLNVVILRKENNKSLNGRSKCPKCKYKLRWFDLVPVFSWLFLLGKCRKCKKKIHWQYPVVEAFTALIFILLFNHISNFNLEIGRLVFVFIWHATMFSYLIIMSAFDFRHKIIPNEWSYTFAILALVQMLWILPLSGIGTPIWSTQMTFDLLAGIIFFIPFFCLWFFSGGKWIGLGDGKLVVGLGWYLGFVSGLSGIILAFWIGGFVAVVLLLIDRLNKKPGSITMKTEIPFGPFLILGTMIHFFWTIDVIGVSQFFIR